MNILEVVRSTNGKIKTVKLNDVEVKAKVCVVNDSVDAQSEVTLILDAVVIGHTE